MWLFIFFFFSSRRRHTRSLCDWSSDVCSSDLHERRPAEVVRDEACVVAVAALLRRLQGHAELALGLRPLSEPDEAEAARVAALGAHDRALVGEFDGAVEIVEGRLAVASAARDG